MSNVISLGCRLREARECDIGVQIALDERSLLMRRLHEAAWYQHKTTIGGARSRMNLRGMSSARLALVAFVLCSFACGRHAFADESPESTPTAAPSPVQTSAPPHARSPFAIAVGVAFPSSTNTVPAGFLSNTGTQFALGLQYGFAAQPAGMAFAYLDLRSVITYGAGAVGLGYSTESLTKERPYVGGGLSYTYAYVSVHPFGGGGNALPPPHCVDNCGSGGGSTSGVGGKAFAGIVVAPGLGIEGSYNFSPAAQGVSTDVIGLALKYRF